ncbi:hypothetical protein ACFQV2_24230 [Actinokineospora soli]|uniref:TIR domain-containing protein n=1 Tax=Actinokineospora soli TaxID=1048753 RepID=A0ABW2TUG9_9PSEU
MFLDTGLRPATRYPDELRDRLLGSELVVAVIHREWLADLRDREGGLDWVHHELATALARGVPVLPVLLAGARLPEAHELPADLADLAKCQAYALRFGQWEHGVRALIETAELFVSPSRCPRRARSPSRACACGGASRSPGCWARSCRWGSCTRSPCRWSGWRGWRRWRSSWWRCWRWCWAPRSSRTPRGDPSTGSTGLGRSGPGTRRPPSSSGRRSRGWRSSCWSRARSPSSCSSSGSGSSSWWSWC